MGAKNRKAKQATYTATWDDDGRVIYAREPAGNRFGRLPLGAMPEIFPGTVGDDWDGAVFRVSDSGRKITVHRDRP